MTSKWAKGSGGPAGDECYNMVAHTLRAQHGSEDGTGRGVPIVPMAIQGNLIGRTEGGPCGVGVSGEGVMFTLTKQDVHGVALLGGIDYQHNGHTVEEPTGPLLKGSPTGGGAPLPAVAIRQTGMAVRRLTPRECERLQGFPDDYTAIPYRGKPAADGPRYKALGNSMAVPVMRWIGQRLQSVHEIPTAPKREHDAR